VKKLGVKFVDAVYFVDTVPRFALTRIQSWKHGILNQRRKRQRWERAYRQVF